MLRNILLSYAAGSLGALVACLVLWLMGRHGINHALGVALAPGLSLYWLYPRLVWGGLWGLLFLLNWHNSRPLLKGLLIGLILACVQLLYVFPFVSHHGFLGLKLGLLTPVVIVLVCAVWGVVTAVVVRR